MKKRQLPPVVLGMHVKLKEDASASQQMYLNNYINYKGEIVDAAGWVMSEISSRPYLACLLPLPRITAENFTRLVEQINVADFNAFIDCKIERWVLLQIEDGGFARTDFEITNETNPAALYDYIKRLPSSSAGVLRGAYACWYDCVQVSSLTDFEKKRGRFRGVGRDYINNVEQRKERMQVAAYIRHIEHIEKDLADKASLLKYATIEEIAYISMMSKGESTIMKVLDPMNVYSESGRKIQDALRHCLAEYNCTPSLSEFLLKVLQPYSSYTYKKYMSALETAIGALIGETVNRTAYNKRKKLKQNLKKEPLAALWSDLQIKAFNDLYNTQMPGSFREKEIDQMLTEMKVPHIREYTIEGLSDRKSLRFDFAIPFIGGVGLIEYDGELHYYVPEGRGGEKKLAETRKHDQMKTAYCETHNIPLLRINYKQPIAEQNASIKDFIVRLNIC